MPTTTQEADPEAAEAAQATPPHVALPPPMRRRKGRPLPHLEHCLNCGRATGPDDNFCPRCGQQNEDATVPLRPLIADALSEIASWDSKLVRTVLPLLFRPGFLTNEFLAGRRVRYLSPLKMYLVISTVFFLVLSLTHHTPDLHLTPDGVPAHAPAPKSKQGAANRAKRTDFIQIGGDEMPLDDLPRTVAAYDARQRDTPGKQRDGFWKALLLRQVIKARQDKQTFSQSIIQGLLSSLPKMMFVLLPLFALMLKVTYWRRRRLYVEHLIFALHSHAFLFTLLTLAVLASRSHVAPTAIWTTVCVALPVYLIAALRRVYRQGWPKTVFKFFWLSWNYVFLLSVAFTLTGLVAFLLA